MQIVIWLAAIVTTWALYRVSKWLYVQHRFDLLGVDRSGRRCDRRD